MLSDPNKCFSLLISNLPNEYVSRPETLMLINVIRNALKHSKQLNLPKTFIPKENVFETVLPKEQELVLPEEQEAQKLLPKIKTKRTKE